MRLCTIKIDNRQRPAVRREDGRLVLIDTLLNRAIELAAALTPEVRDEIRGRIDTAPTSALVDGSPSPQAPFRHPRKIVGIGLNYGGHAGDLGETAPRTTPASFIKGDHTIVGPGEAIEVPAGIGKVTAEAEVGLVIGRYCHRVGVDDALDYVAGVVAVLDQTAEGVLMENPRYLTRVKNYPTFFSFGPEIITMDEVIDAVGDLANLRVTTVHNDRAHRTDVVAGMTFSPAELLSFHSHVMPFYPGDVLSTGTPGAVGITSGDVVQCVLGNSLSVLENPVVSGPRGEIMPRPASNSTLAP